MVIPGEISLVELIFEFFIFSGSSDGGDAIASVMGFVCMEMDVVVVVCGSVCVSASMVQVFGPSLAFNALTIPSNPSFATLSLLST